jgi:hypothetical protein
MHKNKKKSTVSGSKQDDDCECPYWLERFTEAIGEKELGQDVIAASDVVTKCAQTTLGNFFRLYATSVDGILHVSK